jgi:cysteinyl-tRNA synthetase
MLDLKIPDPKIPLKIKAILSQREKLRINKQFMQSDILRNKINNLGYKLEDTPLGAIVFYKNLWIQK